MLASVKLVHRCIIRTAIGCAFALVASGPAFSQSIECPVTSNTSVSGDTTLFTGATPTHTCVVGNNAVITVPNGNALLNQEGVTGKGDTIILDSGTTLQNSGYFQNFGTTTTGYSGGTLTNFGTIYNNAFGTLDTTDGILTNAGNLENFGVLDDETGGGGTLNNTGRLVNEFNVGATGTINVTTVTNFISGTIENDGGFQASSLTNNGTFSNLSGDLTLTGSSTNNGTLTNGTFGTMNLSGSLQNNGTLTNNGVINVLNGGSLNVNAGSTLTNANGGLGTFPGAIQISAGGSLNNLTGGTLSLGGAIVVDGTINTGPGVQLQTATVFGTGTINGNLINNYLVEPGEACSVGYLCSYPSVTAPGTLTINGDYTQNGGLIIDLYGTGAGDLGVLDVNGLATLDGYVSFFVSGFTPVAGDAFTFLDFGSLSGDFNHMFFQDCPTGDVCNLVYGANSVSLDITAASSGGNGGNGGGTTNAPEPSSLWLLSGALLAVAAFSNRKKFAAGS